MRGCRGAASTKYLPLHIPPSLSTRCHSTSTFPTTFQLFPQSQPKLKLFYFSVPPLFQRTILQSLVNLTFIFQQPNTNLSTKDSFCDPSILMLHFLSQYLTDHQYKSHQPHDSHLNNFTLSFPYSTRCWRHPSHP